MRTIATPLSSFAKSTCQFDKKRSLQRSSQHMNVARLTTNKSSFLSYWATCRTKRHSEKRDEKTSCPSFASRMIRLVFKRRLSQRAKSWPGCAEANPASTLTANDSQSSAAIAMSNDEASSTLFDTLPTSPHPMRCRKRLLGDNYSEASWRQRQIHCVNCECFFFMSLSTLSSAAGQYCSLDCQTNFEYLTKCRKSLNVDVSGISVASNGLFDKTTVDGDGLWF